LGGSPSQERSPTKVHWLLPLEVLPIKSFTFGGLNEESTCKRTKNEKLNFHPGRPRERRTEAQLFVFTNSSIWKSTNEEPFLFLDMIAYYNSNGIPHTHREREFGEGEREDNRGERKEGQKHDHKHHDRTR